MRLVKWFAVLLATAWIQLAFKLARRVDWVNDGPIRELVNEQKPYVFAFWHNRFFMAPHAVLNPRPRTLAMVSRSRDGDYVAGILKRLRFHLPTRGSSSRGGREALKAAVGYLQEGLVLGVTPDGPRGPCYKAKNGVVLMAKRAGVPIVPFAYNASCKLEFNSWDKFRAPLPCSKLVFVYGDPIPVDGNTDVRELTGVVERELNRVAEIADKWEF